MYSRTYITDLDYDHGTQVPRRSNVISPPVMLP